jgi:NADH dehydrogenase FAD-containing subunit
MFYLYNFIDVFAHGYKNYNQHKKSNKQNVLVLGDGFFARGFLRTIDYTKYNITQIYRDEFINPQDMFYSLQRGDIFQFDKQFHLRNKINTLFNKNNITKIKQDIKTLQISDKNALINNKFYNFDYMVIGLGAQKSLKNWANELNILIKSKDKHIDIIGTGPLGFEIAMMLNKKNKINMYDILTEDKIFSYVSTYHKKYLLELLDKKNIKLYLGKFYNTSEINKDNYKIFCIGTQPNELTNKIKINDKLQVNINSTNYNNIYVGGDCVSLLNNQQYIKNAQVAYQQGVYVARRLNEEIESDKKFEYKSNGIALNIDDKRILIEGHNVIPDGIYPDFITHMYSMFLI